MKTVNQWHSCCRYIIFLFIVVLFSIQITHAAKYTTEPHLPWLKHYYTPSEKEDQDPPPPKTPRFGHVQKTVSQEANQESNVSQPQYEFDYDDDWLIDKSSSSWKAYGLAREYEHTLFHLPKAAKSLRDKFFNKQQTTESVEPDVASAEIPPRGGRQDSSPEKPPYSLGMGPTKRNRGTTYYKRNNNRRPRSYSRYGGRSKPAQPPAQDEPAEWSRQQPPPQEGSPKKKRSGNFVQSAMDWVQGGNVPKIQVRVEPNTTLKLRKRFRPLKTVVMLGADFNTQLGVWQFKSSWEDSFIGGRLTLAGRELQLSKTWLLSVGAVDDLVTRLRFRASVDLGTGRAYARFGFRTERLSPINVVEGFTLVKQLPLDGNRGNVKLEVKANFAFPEPEIEYSTENHRSVVGMGDIEVNIDELNLLLDY